MSTLRGKISLFIRRHLPDRTKRLIFISSLIANIKTDKEFDQKTLHKLNMVMQLASNESALKLPVQLSHAIWHGRDTFEKYNSAIPTDHKPEKTTIADINHRILEAMPPWLRYGDDAVIEKDLCLLFNNTQTVLG